MFDSVYIKTFNLVSTLIIICCYTNNTSSPECLFMASDGLSPDSLILFMNKATLAMGGSDYDDDWVLPSADITLVLVGKLGYGKSATGNSILGREAFVSEYSHASVTNTCQMGSTTLKDGRTINVIDTPGEFYIQHYCYSICVGCRKFLIPMILSLMCRYLFPL